MYSTIKDNVYPISIKANVHTIRAEKDIFADLVDP
jgi:hypothetical protein